MGQRTQAGGTDLRVVAAGILFFVFFGGIAVLSAVEFFPLLHNHRTVGAIACIVGFVAGTYAVCVMIRNMLRRRRTA